MVSAVVMGVPKVSDNNIADFREAVMLIDTIEQLDIMLLHVNIRKKANVLGTPISLQEIYLRKQALDNIILPWVLKAKSQRQELDEQLECENAEALEKADDFMLQMVSTPHIMQQTQQQQQKRKPKGGNNNNNNNKDTTTTRDQRPYLGQARKIGNGRIVFENHTGQRIATRECTNCSWPSI